MSSTRLSRQKVQDYDKKYLVRNVSNSTNGNVKNRNNVEPKINKRTSIPIPLNQYIDNKHQRIQQGQKQQSNIPQTTSVATPFISQDNSLYYKHPNHYIKFHLNTGSGLPHQNDFYDMLKADFDQLRAQNKKDKFVLTEHQMAKLIEIFEHSAARALVSSADCSLTFTTRDAELAAINEGICGRQVLAVYDYQLAKRKRLGRALLRRYIEPPAHDDISPAIAFRHRIPIRRASTRTLNRPRRNDKNSFNKMKNLKHDFESLLELVKLTRDREVLKREQFLLDSQIFDEKLNLENFEQNYLSRSINLQEANNIPILLSSPSILPHSTYALNRKEIKSSLLKDVQVEKYKSLDENNNFDKLEKDHIDISSSEEEKDESEEEFRHKLETLLSKNSGPLNEDEPIIVEHINSLRPSLKIPDGYQRAAEFYMSPNGLAFNTSEIVPDEDINNDSSESSDQESMYIRYLKGEQGSRGPWNGPIAIPQPLDDTNY